MRLLPKRNEKTGCSAVGSALRSGRRGRAFESPHPDQNLAKHNPSFARFFVFGKMLSQSPSTTTRIPAKVAVVAANYRRPVPMSRQNWQWSQQTIVDQYQNPGKSGSGCSKSISTSTDIAAKVAVVAANYRRPVPMSRQNRQWSQQTIVDQYQCPGKTGSGRISIPSLCPEMITDN